MQSSRVSEKQAAKKWVLDVIARAAPGNDFDQRAALADYILSGRR
ncbi:MAG TPA: hypothetical protein VN829_01910 [Dongiaceae bacterium]|nr:hypothetical protein [Dongiaceae bacterium]